MLILNSEISLNTEFMLASVVLKKKRQKIDPIHLCFGESRRLIRNTENRPDKSPSRQYRDTSASISFTLIIQSGSKITFCVRFKRVSCWGLGVTIFSAVMSKADIRSRDFLSRTCDSTPRFIHPSLHPLVCWSVTLSLSDSFLVADTQLYKRLCLSIRPSICQSVHPSVCPSVHPLVSHGDQVKKQENKHFRYFVCRFEWQRWVEVGVGCPIPPIRITCFKSF